MSHFDKWARDLADHIAAKREEPTAPAKKRRKFNFDPKMCFVPMPVIPKADEEKMAVYALHAAEEFSKRLAKVKLGEEGNE